MLVRSLALLALAVLPTWSLAAAPPNIIVIFCDDLGYGDLGCFGHPSIRTPHLDRLAAEGQRWTSFYVGASVCTPSRAALMTGRLPIRSGMMSDKNRVLRSNSKGGLPASETTIAEMLRERGYATACIGKWHLGHLPAYLPMEHGFDSFWGIPYSNDMNSVQGFPNYRERVASDPNYVPPIEQYNPPLMSGTDIIERPIDQHTLTSRYTQKAVEYIRAQEDKPFFLYLAHNLPHVPLYAGKSHVGKSRRGLFGDVIEEIDAGVGQIVQALEEKGFADNTLIVFSSDNGPWLPFNMHGGSAGPLRGGKGTTFEGGMREPTLFWWPGTIQPAVVMELGATMDLLPTFAALAGGMVPTDRTLDGYDLSPVLLGKETKSPRDAMFFWRQRELYAVRQGPWKVHFITQGCYGLGPKRTEHKQLLLYNVEYDPGEKYDLAAEHPEIIEQLTALAAEHRASIEPVEDQLAK
jgi:arylsulfatase A